MRTHLTAATGASEAILLLTALLPLCIAPAHIMVGPQKAARIASVQNMAACDLNQHTAVVLPKQDPWSLTRLDHKQQDGCLLCISLYCLGTVL